jgi:proteasome beta subunit
MRREESMTVKEVVSLLANILSGDRYYPYYVQLLVGRVDKNSPGIYSLDAVGGIIEGKNAVSTGLGSPVAYGVLEDRYVDNILMDCGVELAIRALHNVMKRDSASGDGINVVIITKDGYMQMKDSEVKKIRDTLT